jgi:hypothetical protein
MTQIDEIIRHLKTHKRGITSKDAINKYGCTRLSAVIKAIEKKGYVIDHEREMVRSRYGKVSVTRYILHGLNN